MNFGTEKQLRRLVEVTATIGLIKMSGQKPDKLKRYRDKLEALAFPEEIKFEWFVIDAISLFLLGLKR